MKSVIYGAGSIGRGFIGQLFSESGFEVVFVDQNKELIDQLNTRKSYPIRFVKDAQHWEIPVAHVRGVWSSDEAAVIDEISTADLMATSVGKNVLPVIAPVIASGLRKRWELSINAPLNMIVCENMVQANVYLGELIAGHLTASETAFFRERIGMVETCIGRNVPVMSPRLQDGDPLRVIAEDYSELPIDRGSWLGELPEIKHMVPYEPFDFYIRKKLYMYNMAHAVTAYLGDLLELSSLAEAIRIPAIRYITSKALQEISIGMAHEYDRDLESLILYSDELLYRFGNRPLGISVKRVAQDPIRKLETNDRLMGAARLCLKHGVFPAHIAVGIAAAYYYRYAPDEESRVLHSYIASEGIGKALAKYSGITQQHPLLDTVLKLYRMLEDQCSLEDILLTAGEAKMHP
ncbi:mannitol dehydrogenase [Diplocloster hominis]|uniref:mannitol dehydrogenase family protein n=1 Tax=Diplocloster hominis TaxID=3079010 RepID=UPI0031B9D305